MPNWTDDIPVCARSGIGRSTNQIYSDNGDTSEEHAYSDRSFHFWPEKRFWLYGIFEGHNSPVVPDFIVQRFPAEFVLGQLRPSLSNDQVKETLKQAFLTVEKAVLTSMDEKLAQKAFYLEIKDFPQDPSEGTGHHHIHVSQKLKEVDKDIDAHSAVVIALEYEQKLFVANLGNTHVILCKMGSKPGELRVFPLSSDHSVNTDVEMTRLLSLGIDQRTLSRLPKRDSCRQLGGFSCSILSAADNPTLREKKLASAEPSIYGPITVDLSFGFLFLTSSGIPDAICAVNKCSLEAAFNTLALYITEEFEKQRTLPGVAQAVVDRVARLHHDDFLNSGQQKQECRSRGDFTLLVLRFNWPMPFLQRPGATLYRTSQPTNQPQPGSKESGLTMHMNPLQIDIPNPPFHAVDDSDFLGTVDPADYNSYTAESDFTAASYDDTYTSGYWDESGSASDTAQSVTEIPLDKDGKVAPYVDFAPFYERLAALSPEEQERIQNIEPKKPVMTEVILEEIHL